MLMLIFRVGFNINKKVTDEILYKDRDSQIKAINATFEAASKPVRIQLILQLDSFYVY